MIMYLSRKDKTAEYGFHLIATKSYILFHTNKVCYLGVCCEAIREVT